MSSARHAVQRSESLIGFGNLPDLTPSHQQVLPSGMTSSTCRNLKKPVSGISRMAITLLKWLLTATVADICVLVSRKVALAVALRAMLLLFSLSTECWQITFLEESQLLTIEGKQGSRHASHGRPRKVKAFLTTNCRRRWTGCKVSVNPHAMVIAMRPHSLPKIFPLQKSEHQ